MVKAVSSLAGFTSPFLSRDLVRWGRPVLLVDPGKSGFQKSQPAPGPGVCRLTHTAIFDLFDLCEH